MLNFFASRCQINKEEKCLPDPSEWLANGLSQLLTAVCVIKLSLY